MLNYLNGVDTEIGKLVSKRKAKKNIEARKKAYQVKKQAQIQTNQIQRANILNKAIKKGALAKKLNPLAVTRIKKQAVIDLNRKTFEEQGEPLVSNLPMEINESANDKFEQGLEEIQSPENLNPDEADSDEGGEEIGRLKDYLKKGGIKKGFKEAKKNIKDNAGAKVRKYLPIIVLARASFLTLLKFNVFKLRDKIAKGYKINPKKIENWWVGTWGGDLKVLLKNLKKSNIGQIGSATAIATAIVSASGVIVSITEVLKSMGIKVNKNENNPIENEIDNIKNNTNNENNENMTPIEENAEIGVYYPNFDGNKKPIKIKKPKTKSDNLKKFTNASDKTKKVLDITKQAIDKIFKGKKPIQAQIDLQEIKNEETKPKLNNKLLIFGGIGAVALYLLMKKK